MERETDVIPLYVFPPASYFHKLLSGPDVQISLGEKYIKQTLRSRFRIAGANNIQVLSIPVVHSSRNSGMAEARLDCSENWQVKHWRSIETAYRKAPFFEFYAHYFEPLFNRKYYLLAELSLEAIHIILKILKSEVNPKLDMNFGRSIEFETEKSDKEYFQVFAERHGFIQDLSIVDLIFNEGPQSLSYL